MNDSSPVLNQVDQQRIIERYSERFKNYGLDIRTLNPGSEEKHRRQHEVHASIGDLQGKKILDIGCGLAHYYTFLKSRGLNVDYIGYDIVEPFIEVNRSRFPEATFEVRDIFQTGIGCTPDYVVMCQVFNNKYEAANNTEIAQRAIGLGFEAATSGLSIDFLSKHVNYEEPHLHYFSPEEMFAFGKTLTRFVTLRHDYQPFHFTLFLHKEPRPCG